MLYERINTLLTRKLSGEATETEIREFRSLIDQNPELEPIVNKIISHWNKKHSSDQEFLEATYLLHLERMKAKGVEFSSGEHFTEPSATYSKRKRIFKSITILSGLLLILLFVIIRITSPRSQTKSEQVIPGNNQVSTRNGSRSKIQLPDGSVVWLNAGSKLEYDKPFGVEDRQVKLSGEAYFDVTKNTEKPFIIHTKKMDIKVVGTAFNVRSYSNEKFSEASLIRGSIEITLKDRKDQKIILKPNEKISVANDDNEKLILKNGEKAEIKSNSAPLPQIVVKQLKSNPVNHIIAEIAWTENKLYFEDESFEDIGPLIERWFGKNVIIQNEALKKVRYTGNFENETLEEVLSYLKLSRPFNYRIGNDTVAIY